MTLFWIICALLLAVALLFVVLPLWRSAWKGHQVQRDAVNLDIFRDQIAEMDADLRYGLLTPEMHEQGKRELQARLLQEVNANDGNAGHPPHNPDKTKVIGLAIFLFLASVGVYWMTGNPDAVLPQAGGYMAAGYGTVNSEAALKDLRDKLAKNAQDADSLLLLARSYAEMERYADAARAYDKLTQLEPNEAELWAEFADALAMASGQSLAGHPTLLLDKALKLDPKNPKALALSGSAAMGRGDFPAAIRYWESVLKMVPKDSEDAKMIVGGIQQARDLIAQGKGGKPMTAQHAPMAEGKKPLTAGSERITGSVTLSAALAGKARPNDNLFVLARAVNGPKVPLAVVRAQVKDLPLKFTLDDSLAMTPQMKLSSFDEVVVIARVSRSGDAIAQPGDFQGMSAAIKPGSSGVRFSIDNVIK